MKRLFAILMMLIPLIGWGQVVDRTADRNYMGSATFGTQSTTYTPTNPSAWLEIGKNGTDKGVIIPRVNDTANIANPVKGLVIFLNADSTIRYYTNYWKVVGRQDLSKYLTKDEAEEAYLPLERFSDSLNSYIDTSRVYSYKGSVDPNTLASDYNTGSFYFGASTIGTISDAPYNDNFGQFSINSNFKFYLAHGKNNQNPKIRWGATGSLTDWKDLATMDIVGSAVHDSINSYIDTSQLVMFADSTVSYATPTQLSDSINVGQRIDTVATIDQLEAYNGPAYMLVVTDTLRGGVFGKTSEGNIDDGVVFQGDGTKWRRSYNGNVVNVLWYGADPSGDAGSSDAIQRAIDKVEAAPSGVSIHDDMRGGTVFFPPGNYKIDATITLKNRVNLNGTYWTTLFLDRDVTEGLDAMFVSPNTDLVYVKYSNLRLLGNYFSPVSYSENAFSILQSSGHNRSDIKFENLLIAHFSGDGIYVENGWQYHVANCTIEICKGTPIYFNTSWSQSTGIYENVRRINIENSFIYGDPKSDSSNVIKITGNPNTYNLFNVKIAGNTIFSGPTVDNEFKTVYAEHAMNVNITNNNIINAIPTPSAGPNNRSFVYFNNVDRGVISSNIMDGQNKITSHDTEPAYGISILNSDHINIAKSNIFHDIDNNLNIDLTNSQHIEIPQIFHTVDSSIVSDTIISYAGDYSQNFTDLSLVNKAYLESGIHTDSIVTNKYSLSDLNTAPASATAPGTKGEIRVTADYIYVCIAADTWVRCALATW